jgi:hypothetical protein
MDFMLATPEAVNRELAWAHGRTSSRLHGTRLDTSVHDLEDCLTDTEVKWLRAYRAKYPRFAFVMNNNPNKMPIHSGSHRFLGTITKKSFLVWPGMSRRAFVPEELLMLQGYPIFSPARAGERLSWDVDMPRSRHGITEQAGNAMHTHVVGLSIIYACCFCLTPEETMPSLAPVCDPTSSAFSVLQRAAALKRELSRTDSDDDAYAATGSASKKHRSS